jgi:hypothetical protein
MEQRTRVHSYSGAGASLGNKTPTCRDKQKFIVAPLRARVLTKVNVTTREKTCGVTCLDWRIVPC